MATPLDFLDDPHWDDPHGPERTDLADDAPQRSSGAAAVASAPAPAPSRVEIPPVLLGPRSFLCGSAGTGKTFLARHLAASTPGTVLAATTGIASVNLGEGTTINALLGYFDTKSLMENWQRGSLAARIGKLWRAGLRRILLDEVSMLDGDQLTILSKALDELAGRGYTLDAQLADEVEDAREENQDPVALTLIGDFAQLPPVKAKFAFEVPEWATYAEATHTLTKIWRQTDLAFVTALQAARRGQPEAVIEFFRHRLVTDTDTSFNGVTLFGTNEAVERHNYYRLSRLAGEATTFASSRWGVERGDWKNIPAQFPLKIGALVMLLANERAPQLGEEDPLRRPLIYANGDLGVVKEMIGTQVYVQLQRNQKIVEVQWIARQNLKPLEPGRKKQLREEGNAHLLTEDGRSEVIGEVTYLPVRLAWASTVHKSQGLSLDTVQVNTREGFFKTPGMLYVSLSRARTAEGLRLVGTIDGLRERCTVHGKILRWL